MVRLGQRLRKSGGVRVFAISSVRGPGGSPEASFEFMFWPPVPPAVRRLQVIVSTLWEAAWAELDIPGRSAQARLPSVAS